MSDKVVYELSIDMPNLPSGEPVQIAGLGTFENGSTYDITDDEANSFRSYNSRPVPVLNDNEEVVGSEVEQGPTLLQAMKDTYGVEVTTVVSKGGNGS